MKSVLLLAAASVVKAAVLGHPSKVQVSIIENRQVLEKRQQYFQTTPELYAGTTITGQAAFLAQTNPAPFAGTTYIAPQPLETQEPISGAGDANIFELMGNLAHYFPNPDGFGIEEYPLPTGANITWVQVLHRHGSRYPSSSLTVVDVLEEYPFTATGELEFLNTWTYKLGEQILVPVGNQELFDSGVSHVYQYGHLAPQNGSKIIARTTTEDRMLKSAEYFLAGFFGLSWTTNATIELLIEETGFNNSLNGDLRCTNSNDEVSSGGSNASDVWQPIYLANAVKRLNKLITFSNNSITLSASDVYDLQELCAYETVALGYSSFCSLFTYEEWQGFEYNIDLEFAGNYAFQSPAGRAIGIGWVQELLGRLEHHYVTSNGGSANITLDSMASTFPLYQNLNFDFTHDNNIMSILTALGFLQFADVLPDTYIPTNRQLIVSHLEPFGARVDIELIQTPHPLNQDLSYEESGAATTYIHFMINQRTIDLHQQYSSACIALNNGWCELGNFLEVAAGLWELSEYEFACFGDYPAYPYTEVLNGNPSIKQQASNVVP